MVGNPKISLSEWIAPALPLAFKLTRFPSDEHHRRSPECTFFTSQQNAKPKTTRGKKGRTSKASRMSIQTNTTVMTEDHTMTDAGLERESVLTTAQDTSAPVASKGKKIGRAKKGQSKAKTAKMQAEEPQLPSSFVEPEDDDFEVKVVEPPVKKSTRGKKRTSEQMEADNLPEDIVAPPPPKRRAGRTRGSTVKPESVLEPSMIENTVVDVTMTDAEEQPPPGPKKKGGRKRASSTTRKTSTASTASKASLRAEIPDDDEIDAALEADLNRPLTDGEDTKMVDLEPPVKRGRVASNSKKGKASAATLRGETQEVTEKPATIEDSIVQVLSTQDPESMIVDEIPAIKNPKGRTINAKGAANAPNPTETINAITTEEDAIQLSKDMEVDDFIPQVETIPAKAATKAKGRQPKGRQTSRKKAAQASEAPAPAVQPLEAPAEDSDLTIVSKAEEAGHELDDSLASQSTVVRGSRKASATQKKGKGPKKAAAANKNVHEDVQPPPQMEMELDHEPAIVAAEPSIEVVPDEEPKGKKTKRQTRSKGNKASTSQIVEDPVVAELDLVNEDVEMVSETPPDEVEVVRETPMEEDQPETVIVMEKQEVEHELEPDVELPSLPVHPPTPQQRRQIPSPTPSPQSSDAENHPPSSRPSQTRPPLTELSPMHPRTVMVQLASTPKQPPSKQDISTLETTFPWSRIDFEEFFAGTPRADREKVNLEWFGTELTGEEKNMTVEEWTRYVGRQQEEALRDECERVISRFESEGMRALKALEGIMCVDS